MTIASKEPIVLKVGGSCLSDRKAMLAILDVIAQAQNPIVIVPGGGPFADAICEAQQNIGFDDETAHRLAILAMHQTGIILAGILSSARTVETVSGIRDALVENKTPIWLPLRELDADQTLPRSWDTTSDAIAARLAERISSAHVILVKTCAVDATQSLAVLVKQGVIDPVFPEIIMRAGLTYKIIGNSDAEELRHTLSSRSGSTSTHARATAPSP